MTAISTLFCFLSLHFTAPTRHYHLPLHDPLPILSATIIPSLALPLSIVATFAVMYVLGFSLDNFSLMALTLSVGFVVDDRSEEHTSELQSHVNIVCRLLLEKSNHMSISYAVFCFK